MFLVTDPKTGQQVNVDEPEVRQEMYNRAMDKSERKKELL